MMLNHMIRDLQKVIVRELYDAKSHDRGPNRKSLFENSMMLNHMIGDLQKVIVRELYDAKSHDQGPTESHCTRTL